MTTLTAFKFPTADGAKNMLDTVKAMQKEELITLLDAAIVAWPAGKKKSETKQPGHLLRRFGPQGIGRDFIEQVDGQVTEGTSAPFLMTVSAVPGKVFERLRGYDLEVIASNLSPEEETMLRDALAIEKPLGE
jgi:uncharacterized membrane protein